MSAKMIASCQQQQPWFSRPAAVGAILLVLAVPFLAGCATDRETTMMRSSRARSVGVLRSERKQQERELELWEATRDQATKDIGEARFDSVRTSSHLRGVRSALLRQLKDLARIEQELLDAQQRAAEIEVELKPLRALEQQLKDQQKSIVAARGRVESLTQEVGKANADAAKQEAVLKPKLVLLQKRLADLKAAGLHIAETEAKIAAAQKVLVPPAPKQPPPKK
ncbi:MAG: DNA repair exonuclease SbcCD ATPase subunit [Planctomycetota bacterium]|jgi:DNA repair exonuclease SbcCD ATPase subunit